MNTWITQLLRRSVIGLGVMALTVTVVFAASSTGLAPNAYPPRARPDRVVLSWTGDPAVTQAVTWRTDASVSGACAEILPAGDGPIAGQAARVAARSVALQPVEGPAAQCHSVEFTDLAPNTLYAYRVGDGRNWSEWCHFRTARREAAPFTFLFLGDPQVDIRSQWSRVWRQAWLAAPHAAFALLTGDLVNKGGHDGEWGEWFEAVGWMGATRPLVLAPGSHEYVSAAATPTATTASKKSTAGASAKTSAVPKSLTAHWRAQFTLPANGPEALAETCYCFDYQGARFVVLNTQEQTAAQADWLRATLRGARPPWTVLAFHEPIFSGGRQRDNQKLRTVWKPVIDEMRVDLVLTGHDHVYARSGLDGVPTGYPAEREVVNGTVYVVSVSGPKMYDLSAGEWAERAAANTQTYQIITVEGDTLRYCAATAAGRRFDAFTLRKRAGQRNELTEELPRAAR